MQASQLPSKIPLPFANSGTKNTIPTASQIGIAAGAASLTDGFPPLTMTPLSAGGVPPSGADFNGILNLITAIQQWQSAGGIFKYDAAFSTSIGGYPKGAILQSSDGMSNWLNLVDNNTTNPDSGGANWISLSAGRLLNIQVFANAGTFTYTPTAGTTSVVVDVVGGGGAGGGAPATGAGSASVGGGGGAGGYAKKRITAGFAGATVTVGAGGAANSGTTGGAGGSSSFGAFVSATGGSGGTVAGASGGNFQANGGGGGASSGGDLNAGGAAAAIGLALYASSGIILGGTGANGPFGGSGFGASNAVGGAGVAPGSGGGGSSLLASQAAIAGGGGAKGLVIVYEYA